MFQANHSFDHIYYVDAYYHSSISWEMITMSGSVIDFRATNKAWSA